MSLSYLAQRAQNQIISRKKDKSSDLQILAMPSDAGVVRNGGKNGAKFGPRAISAQLEKMIYQSDYLFQDWSLHEIKHHDIDFDSYQQTCLKSLESLLLKPARTMVQIGGGHDHIYPWLKALSRQHQKICVLNLDAHCDTRRDTMAHSGTPFRQFMDEFHGEFHLFQYGIEFYANDPQTLQGNMQVWDYDKVDALSDGFSQLPIELLQKTLIDNSILVLSIDLDAISGFEMPAVSAPAHRGLPLQHVREIIQWYSQQHDQKYMGLYEFNPKYDHVTGVTARAAAQLLLSLVQP